MRSEHWPVCSDKHNYRDASQREILLIPQVLIGRNEDIETICFRGRQQRTVLKAIPTTLKRRLHIVI